MAAARTRRRQLVLESLETRNLLTAAIFQNPIDATDVNVDGVESAADALAVINYIDLHGTGPLELQAENLLHKVDVSGDDVVSSVDVLSVINRLNASADGGQVTLPDVTSPPLNLEVNAPPAGNIFEIASAAIQDMAATGQLAAQKVSEQQQKIVQDDGPLLEELRRRMVEQTRLASERLSNAAQRGDVPGILREQQNLVKLGTDTGRIASEIGRNDAEQIVDLQQSFADFNRQLGTSISTVAQNPSEQIIDLEKAAVEMKSAELDAAIAAGEQERVLKNDELLNQIFGLGNGPLTGEVIGTFSGNFSVSHPTCNGQVIQGQLVVRDVQRDGDQIGSNSVEVVGLEIYDPVACQVVGTQNSLSGQMRGMLEGGDMANGTVDYVVNDPNTGQPVQTSFQWVTQADPHNILIDNGMIVRIGAKIFVNGVERGSFILTPQP